MTASTKTNAEVVRDIVSKRIGSLQANYLANRPAGVAGLARLRRGVGKPAGSVPDILEYTLAAEFVGDPTDDEATALEVAAHIAMTLYATHQQSQPRRMHEKGRRFGQAVRGLAPDKGKDTAVSRRFALLGSADELDELTHHLRGMVQLMRGARISLDYGLLAAQLVRWQEPGGPTIVRRVWGRDFHAVTSTKNPTS
ncbi:type I-E CRISPR-associated protein Cse2/CasB [Actinokineospora iranica]|uniref:type I-E CRISPR-associated protein Cse2/CasB n=1 Tax=Actinokineospora iranica TaxID=1271860 RepID=UPI001E41A830|nr:type I-E CRISPR-associated protein Cse2/CasB [Actinokineospora iranica]